MGILSTVHTAHMVDGYNFSLIAKSGEDLLILVGLKFFALFGVGMVRQYNG